MEVSPEMLDSVLSKHGIGYLDSLFLFEFLMDYVENIPFYTCACDFLVKARFVDLTDETNALLLRSLFNHLKTSQGISACLCTKDNPNPSASQPMFHCHTCNNKQLVCIKSVSLCHLGHNVKYKGMKDGPS